MPTGPHGEQRPGNPTAAGARSARLATGEAEEASVDQERQASAKKGAAAALTPTERKLIARQAAKARQDA